MSDDKSQGTTKVIARVQQSLLIAITSDCKGDSMAIKNVKYVLFTPEHFPKPSSQRRQQVIHECPILSNIEPKQIKVRFQNRRSNRIFFK
ncbi:putative transcription factor homeobox-WOX family [Helianthus anomalus]